MTVVALGLLIALVPLCGGESLTPPYFNLAFGKKVNATATCGDEGPEVYCLLVGANSPYDSDDHYKLIQGQTCDICDMNDPAKKHPPEYAVDEKETWWQSPPISRHRKYNEVTLTIDLGQEFHVAYVFIRMGNSPRPKVWTLEKSTDYGETFKPWQHFAPTPLECETSFGKDSLLPVTRDDSVICSTEYSQIVPLEGGEIPISLTNNRPSKKNYFNSSVLQEWTRATNVRLRLMRTNNLLGHLMSVSRQDPTVTRRYFYSIKDISIGGRCMCNGHADICYRADPSDTKLVCQCQHQTYGPQCDRCRPGYEQKKWRISQSWDKFSCEPCNCHNHTTECEYDAEVDSKHLSLDIHGKYEGGGVCKNCQHNTQGTNCNQCVPKYYRPHGKKWHEVDVCQPCDCNVHYSTGNCAEGSGICECREEYTPPYCDSCREGFYGHPYCKPCPCNQNGTEERQCTPIRGECTCKYNYYGPHCADCADGYYSPECKDCQCDPLGSESGVCDKKTGDCKCKSKYSGRTCNQCEVGFMDYPTCNYCNCDSSGTLPSICNNVTGECLCKEGFGGARCDQCITGYYLETRGSERVCVPCNCSVVGSMSVGCLASGKCTCMRNFGGKQCDQCSPGHYKYPECLPCNCDTYGSIGSSCDDNGQCQCKSNFDKLQCHQCKEHFYNYPACEECNCDPRGVITGFAGCASVPAGELCQCKDRVMGRICNICKPLFYNLQKYNPQGCDLCECNLDGTLGGVGVCEAKTGQCMCKRSVSERTCNECNDGFYSLSGNNVFGCTPCDCDAGGSLDNNCDKETGQCKCHSRVQGRRCNETARMHYFPTLHQYQFEAEDGTTLTGPVRVRYNHDVFPNYSWRGYAHFSPSQSEVNHTVYLDKSSLYLMVIRYVNQSPNPVVATIVITPENPQEITQTFYVSMKPTTEPEFVTVAGKKGDTPAPFVMNPGYWDVSIKSKKEIEIDYFVLIPSAYYEASVLTQQVEKPCVVGDGGLCRHFAYPVLTDYVTVKGSEADGIVLAYISNPEQLKDLDVGPTDIPILDDSLDGLAFDINVEKAGRYVILIEYVTPIENPNTGGAVTVKLQTPESTTDGSYAIVNLNSCPYTSACRQVLVDELARVKIFDLRKNSNTAVIQSEPAIRVGIKSIVAIPEKDWHLDYITPKPFCIRKNKCTPAIFSTAVDSKKVEFEQAGEGVKLDHILSNKTRVVHLDHDVPLEIESKIDPKDPGSYVFVVHYFQRDNPESTIDVTVQSNGQTYEAKMLVDFVPSGSGGRAVVQQSDGNIRFPLTENFKLSFKDTTGKGVWLDYFLVVPAAAYQESFLKEFNTLDNTGEFITTCAQNHYHVNITDSGFCRDSIFSITTNYNSGALPCNCDHEGSNSFLCETFGGQCSCKPNVIGRTCKQCKPGYFGFPDCQKCNCPSLCEEDGTCSCPPNVEGEQCDRCKPLSFEFDPYHGCIECNCHSLGVVDGNLQCDLLTGDCQCKTNVVGRKCDKCVAGHYGFPFCDVCNCNLAGTELEVCDQETAMCLCKPQVTGQGCDTCTEGHFDLQDDNAEGCTKCFCFNQATRCSSSNLVWAQLRGMDSWYLVSVEMDGMDIERLTVEPQRTESAIGAELTRDETQHKIIYFEAPAQYLGSKLTSYGGKLNYTIIVTTSAFSHALPNADIILEGPLGLLFHKSTEQPPIAEYWSNSVKLVEKEFKTVDDEEITREQFMTTLKDLRAIYIRATYWENGVTTRLESVTLDTAIEPDWSRAEPATSVEQCRCPAAYKGLSCEACAEGHYRVPGPHGGICTPCQCNGHSRRCDVNTGICLECQDNTMGDHCEMCVAGYYGDASYGTPGDCLICPCPIPIASNNFAKSCNVSDDGGEVACQCFEGYAGQSCDYCAAGYYGLPNEAGGYCKQCNCSGNIEVDDPGSCDSVTGECLKCVNNTSGNLCQFCKPGFYGDAIILKDCKACSCDEYGTEQCNSTTGTCECKPGVIGERCDRCAPDHWGMEGGAGCLPCNCGLATKSSQCDLTTGKCECPTGVTGKQCDQCANGYWNYSEYGCENCNCNKNHSIGLICDKETGHCSCLPGALGDKCDQCPYRWVLRPNIACEECNPCQHALLDSVEELNGTLAPVASEFKNKADSYFTTQRLHYIQNRTRQLKPMMQQLDPQRSNTTGLRESVDKLESDARNMHRKAEFASTDSDSSIAKAIDVIALATETLKQAQESKVKARQAVEQVSNLAISLEVGEQPKVDSALVMAQQIHSDMKEKNLSSILQNAHNHFVNASKLEERMKVFTLPVGEHVKDLAVFFGSLKDFNDKVEEAKSFTEKSRDTAKEAKDLNAHNKDSRFSSKINNVPSQFGDARGDLFKAFDHHNNATFVLELAKSNIPNMTMHKNSLERLNHQVQSKIKDFKQQLPTLLNAKTKADVHKRVLLTKTHELDGLLASVGNYSKDFGYSSIIDAVQEAYRLAQKADNNTTQASTMTVQLKTLSEPALKQSRDLAESAQSLCMEVDKLTPGLNNAEKRLEAIKNVNDNTNNAIRMFGSELEAPKKSLTNQLAFDYSALNTAMDKVNSTMKDVVEVEIPEDLRRDVATSKAKAEALPREVESTKMNISIIKNRLSTINDLVPNIRSALDTANSNNLDLRRRAADEQVKELKALIERARNLANRIKVGMSFDQGTLLQLETPDTVEDLATASNVSVFFRTKKDKGLVFYLGNPKGTKLRHSTAEDFMALEIVNGYPSLLIDIGAGPQRINSNKKVSDNKWYQAVIDRVGRNVKLSIREQNNDKTETVHSTGEYVLDGDNTIFNLDKEQSKLYVGSIPPNAGVQAELSDNIFEGQIEDLMVGDTPVGLWNFIKGENLKGAKERDQLISRGQTSGFRFNGKGYLGVYARTYLTGDNDIISFSFKTYAPDGVLFYLHNDDKFVSIEMRGGCVFLQMSLGGEVVTVGTLKVYNDGEWHRVAAGVIGKIIQLKVDNQDAGKAEANGDSRIGVPDLMYIGGYPPSETNTYIVQARFDGCIQEIIIASSLVDLNQNAEAYGVSPGCQFPNLVTVYGERSYLRYHNISSEGFQATLKFKTTSADGIIFYATNRDQTAGISLSLDKGKLALISQKQRLDTGSNTYNDDQWHVITVTHSPYELRLSIDDTNTFRSESPPPQLILINGQVMLGGVPQGYLIVPEVTATRQSLVGCIGEVSVVGRVLSPTEAESAGAIVGRCSQEVPSAAAAAGRMLPVHAAHPAPTLTPAPNIPLTTTHRPIETSTESRLPSVSTRFALNENESRRPPPPRRPAPVPESGCALPIDTSLFNNDYSEGYRFGTQYHSHIEFRRLQARTKDGFDLSVEFNTQDTNGGYIFYAADARHKSFVALFMKSGKLYLLYNCGESTASIVSYQQYNDGQWYSVSVVRKGGLAKLTVGDETVGDARTACAASPLPLQPPVYYGGLPGIIHNITQNTRFENDKYYLPFKGCLRKLEVNNRPLEDIKNQHHVLPCRFDNVESGVYFQQPGSYLKLVEKFKVGIEMSISMEVKPRSPTGLLLAVHGRIDYMVLEMINNEVIVRIQNGKGPFQAKYQIGDNFSLCDGKWHTINVIKSRHVVSVVVDHHFSNAGVGLSASTDTRSPLYIGGVDREIQGTTKGIPGFSGCIRNIVIRNSTITIPLKSAVGNATVGVCPTD